MKKISIFLLVGVLGVCSPAFALFTNGGFEDGNFNGWTLYYGTYNSGNTSAPTNAPNFEDITGWTSTKPGSHPTSIVMNNTTTMSGQTLDINPYYGNYMARINDIAGGYHATRLTQSDSIDQTDIDSGGTLYVKWGAALVDPNHILIEQPFFGIVVSKNGVAVDSLVVDATTASNDPDWSLAGPNLYYRTDLWSYSLASFVLGDVVTIDLFVADCGQGGHGGYAFLDGIGTINPDNNVPEPATLLLLGLGLIGLTGYRRKM